MTFVRFFLEPAKHIGQAIREFIVSAFEGLPIILWLPVYAFIILLLILVLFCLGRYRIAMPFLNIEPARTDGDRHVRALEDRVRTLQVGLFLLLLCIFIMYAVSGICKCEILHFYNSLT